MTALDRTRLTGSLVSHARPAFWRGGHGILAAYEPRSVGGSFIRRDSRKKTKYFCGKRRDNEARLPLPLAGRAESEVCLDEAALDRTRLTGPLVSHRASAIRRRRDGIRADFTKRAPKKDCVARFFGKEEPQRSAVALWRKAKG